MSSTILIIDSTDAILDVMQIVLKEAGFQVITSVDPLSPIKVALLSPGLIIIEDWLNNLPNGREICKALKAFSLTAQIPVLLMSTLGTLDTMVCEAGADGGIAKPFDIEEIVTLISATLAQTSS